MRIEDAHEGRALCAKQAEVSPVSNKSHKHALRAMWIDDCELWVKMHSRPDRWPQIVRFASGRADSLANRRFVNDQRLKNFELAILFSDICIQNAV